MNLFCPSCGKQTFEAFGRKKLVCASCGFVFYRNAACAVAATIVCGDELLVGTRARDPGKGSYDLPGGFVDPGESLEQALKRELREELGLSITEARYLGSGSNDYLFADVLYTTTDAFFEVRLQEKPKMQAMDDVAQIDWVKLCELDLEAFAFNSQKQMLRRCYLAPDDQRPSVAPVKPRG